MKPILVQMARLALSLGALYAAVLVVTLLLVPREPSDVAIDSARASSSLYITEPKYVFMSRARLESETDRLLLVGASNTQAGFKQRELQPLLPRLSVHNLAVGGSNITQLAQIVDLVREVQSPEARRHDTYVLGLWYGVFASDEARWYTPDREAGDTDIDIERYRYGFYRRTEQGASPLLPPHLLDLGTTLIHPYLVLDRAARDATSTLREQLSGKPKKLTDDERNRRVISAQERKQYLDFWRDYMGGVRELGARPFDELETLVKTISADGARVVLVDMPIPAWHAAGSPLARDYRSRLERVLPSLRTLPGVSFIDLAGASNDDDFSDEVHPKPRVSPFWAQRLASALVKEPAAEASARATLPVTTGFTETAPAELAHN